MVLLLPLCASGAISFSAAESGNMTPITINIIMIVMPMPMEQLLELPSAIATEAAAETVGAMGMEVTAIAIVVVAVDNPPRQ